MASLEGSGLLQLNTRRVSECFLKARSSKAVGLRPVKSAPLKPACAAWLVGSSSYCSFWSGGSWAEGDFEEEFNSDSFEEIEAKVKGLQVADYTVYDRHENRQIMHHES